MPTVQPLSARRRLPRRTRPIGAGSRTSTPVSTSTAGLPLSSIPARPPAVPATPSSNKERDVRRWFVEQDLIEGVIYLPENLFYNTTAPGIIILLNKAKPEERKGNLLLINASKEFEKGTPKNYLTGEGMARIVEACGSGREEEQFSRIVIAR